MMLPCLLHSLYVQLTSWLIFNSGLLFQLNITLPRNTIEVYAELQASGNGDEEFWVGPSRPSVLSCAEMHIVFQHCEPICQ